MHLRCSDEGMGSAIAGASEQEPSKHVRSLASRFWPCNTGGRGWHASDTILLEALFWVHPTREPAAAIRRISVHSTPI